ncbi:MAG: YihY/virulence factor BrkB family protein [Ilumatobacteraceae bacterium]
MLGVRLLDRVDEFQRRHRLVAMPIAVSKRFGEHGGTRLAATVSYYSFFSVFPLLLALVTILGIVLQDRPDLRDDLLDGFLGQIPVIGTQLTDAQQPLEGSIWVLVLGLATAIWAGLGAVGALQQAFDDISDVPVHRRPTFLMKRLRELAFLGLLGIGLAASTLMSNIATLFDLGVFAGAVGLLLSLVIDAALLLMMFSVLPAERRAVRLLLPGAVVGAVGLVVLQQLGSYVVRRFIAGASDTYGTFAVVIALLSWFHLVSRLLLLSAELNEVLLHDLSPRRLLAGGSATDADRRAQMLDVQRIQRDPTTGYAVTIDQHVSTDEDPLGDDDPATVTGPSTGVSS